MKYGPEITLEISNYLQNGNNRTDSCILAGISYETFTVWMKDKPEFSESVKKAEAHCKARNIAIVQKAALTTWQAACWWLERKHPDEFALKMRNADTGYQEEVPARMAKRAHELLKKLEGPAPTLSKNGHRNGNGIHPEGA